MKYVTDKAIDVLLEERASLKSSRRCLQAQMEGRSFEVTEGLNDTYRLLTDSLKEVDSKLAKLFAEDVEPEKVTPAKPKSKQTKADLQEEVGGLKEIVQILCDDLGFSKKVIESGVGVREDINFRHACTVGRLQMIEDRTKITPKVF